MRASGRPVGTRPAARARASPFRGRPPSATRPFASRDTDAVSPVVGTILMVAITVVLVGLLYAIVAGLIASPAVPQSIGLVVESTTGNWSVRVVSVPPGKLPNTTYLLIRDANGSFLLPRMAIANFTEANWATLYVLYQDAHPQVAEIEASDRFLIDQARYPRGSVLEISDSQRILAMQTLQ